MSRYKELFKDNGKLDYKFRDDLNANFTTSDSEFTRVEDKVDTNNSDVNSRITQVEQDRIDEDNTLDSKIDTKETESIERDDDLDGRIDNIIAQSGTSDTEVVDARLGSDGVTYTVLKDRLDVMHEPLIEQDEQTAELQHGTNVIQSDQSSPLMPNIFGGTLVNLLGKLGRTATSATRAVDSGKYYVIINEDGTDVTVNGTVQTVPHKFTGETSADLSWSSGKVGLYEITSETYNAIGVSLTDADVERLFPYVDSVQHVKNPVLSVEGDNLLPPFYEWDDKDKIPFTISSPYIIEVDASSETGAVIDFHKKITPNQNYTFSGNGLSSDMKLVLYERDQNGNETQINDVSSDSPYSFTTSSTANEVRCLLYTYNNGTFTFSQPILNLGSSALPFVERNPSYLYAEVTLAGNSVEKDISYESNGTWYVDRHFEIDYKLDGSRNISHNANYTGFKAVEVIDMPTWTNDTDIVVKHDGSIIQHYLDNGSVWDKGDISRLSSKLYLTVSNTDSGFTDSMTPSSDMWKGYFNGWQYTGDGTTHSWVSIVDGTTTPATQSEAFVADSANSPDSYKNYFLSYQLSESQTINVDHLVEGSLSIEGDAQVTVNSGGEFSESLSPDGTGTATLAHSASEVFGVFDGTAYVDYTVVDADNVQITNYDDTKSYTANYIRQDKYDFTTNLNNVKAHYNQSFKSSFESVVTKQSDIATEVSIHDKQILDIMLRLDAGGL